MDSQWRNFLLVVTLAAAAAIPAFGESVLPTAGPAARGEATSAPVPDFSGLWVHANPGYEPLASGPHFEGELIAEGWASLGSDSSVFQTLELPSGKRSASARGTIAGGRAPLLLRSFSIQ